MAATLTTSTNYAVKTGNTREDLSDAITLISPMDTPFMSSIGKDKCTNTTPEWLVEELDDPATNAATEGADATYSAESAATRIANITQIIRDTLSISGTLEATTLAGRKSETKYQLGLKLKELARDAEYALLNGVYATSPRQMRGLVDWLDDATYYGTDTYYAFGGSKAATNDLTETIFNDRIQAAWAEGGDVDLVLASPAQKRIISSFNATNKITVNADQADRRVIATIDYYESDFGTVKVVPERWFANDTSGGVFYDKVAFVETSKWAVTYLRQWQTEEMAKVGDAMNYMILAEMTLRAKAPKANALIVNLSRV